MSQGPLSGIKVVDCTTVIAGPLCTQILADQGAEIIKIEPIEGDLVRNVGPILAEGFSATFLALGRNKRSLSLDLRQPEAQAIVRKLSAQADLFVTNSRPGVMAKHGLGYDALKAENPKLVYGAITGFGNEGPMAEQRAYDPIIQALAGIASLQDNNNLLSQTVCDKTTGIVASQAVTAGLLHAARTGEGQLVEVSMLEATMSFLACDVFWPITAVGREVSYPDFKRIYIPWETKNGHVVLVILADKEFKGMTEEFNCQELLDDPRFNSMINRFQNWDELVALLRPQFTSCDSDEILQRLWRAGVPAAPLNTVEQLPNNEQILASGMFSETEHPVAGRHRSTAMAANFSKQENTSIQAAPTVGEHSREVLTEMGMSEADINSLFERKISR